MIDNWKVNIETIIPSELQNKVPNRDIIIRLLIIIGNDKRDEMSLASRK